MTDRQSRLAMQLGLIPLVVGCSVFTALLIHRDGTFWLCASGTFISATVFAWLWRKYVRWRTGKIAGTGVTAVVVLVHLLAWQPVCSVGCMEDVLIGGQCLAMLGMGMGLAIWIWWGRFWNRLEQTHQKGRLKMSPQTVRIIVGLALVPLVPGLWLVGSLCCPWRDIWAYVAFSTLMVSIPMAIWVLLWRKHVSWTPERKWMVIGLTALVIVLPTIFHFIASKNEEVFISASLIGLGLWVMLTARIWRKPADPIQEFGLPEVLRCGDCDYRMAGLHQARCPECGRQYTLDELFGQTLSALHDDV